MLAIIEDRTRALPVPIAVGEAKFHAVEPCAHDLRAKTNPALERFDLLHQGFFEIAQAALARPFIEAVQIVLKRVDLFQG